MDKPMSQFHQTQLARMLTHFRSHHPGTEGEFTHSFRIVQQGDKFYYVSQIKCSGCGHSLDW